ncbi:hypothetical protein GCM10023405_00240 [Streptomonospora salina]
MWPFVIGAVDRAVIRFRVRWVRGRTGLVTFFVASAALLVMWFALPTPAAPSIDSGAG